MRNGPFNHQTEGYFTVSRERAPRRRAVQHNAQQALQPCYSGHSDGVNRGHEADKAVGLSASEQPRGLQLAGLVAPGCASGVRGR